MSRDAAPRSVALSGVQAAFDFIDVRTRKWDNEIEVSHNPLNWCDRSPVVDSRAERCPSGCPPPRLRRFGGTSRRSSPELTREQRRMKEHAWKAMLAMLINRQRNTVWRMRSTTDGLTMLVDVTASTTVFLLDLEPPYTVLTQFSGLVVHVRRDVLRYASIRRAFGRAISDSTCRTRCRAASAWPIRLRSA